jgi:hypothetical protein
MKKYLSLIFPISLVVCMTIIALYKINDYNKLFIFMVLLYFIWIIIESLISKKDFNESIRDTDHYTREIYAVSQGFR